VGVALSLLATASASRKCMFGAQKIKLEKAGVLGSCTLTNWPPTPMLFCADPVPIPLACTPQAHLNKISFGMSWKDYALGFTLIAIDMVVSYAFSKIEPGGKAGEGEGGDAKPKSAEQKEAADKDKALEALHDRVSDNPQARLGGAQETVTAVLETIAYSAFAEPGQEHEIVWLDVPGVGPISTELEKTDDGFWMKPQSKERKEELEKKDSYRDDPDARYGKGIFSGWGEVL
jgi:hypothetical protein